VAWEWDENLGFEWRPAERVDQRHRDSDDGPAGVSREAANHPGPPAINEKSPLAGLFSFIRPESESNLEGSTNRQESRFGRRSRPQGERHGWRESGVSREAANHPGPPANLNYVSGRHTLAGFFLLLPYCYLSDDLPVT